MSGMIDSLHIHEDRMRKGALGGFMAATDLADYLVGKGMPFREAHEVVGKLVLALERDGRTLQELSAAEYRGYASEFGPDVIAAVDIDGVVARRISAGGTGHEAVRIQVTQVAEALAADDAWLTSLPE